MKPYSILISTHPYVPRKSRLIKMYRVNLDPSGTETNGHMLLPFITWVDSSKRYFVRLLKSHHQRVTHSDIQLIYADFYLFSLRILLSISINLAFWDYLPHNATCIQISVSGTYFKRIQYKRSC